MSNTPITIPNVFATQVNNIPLSQLDADFNTVVTSALNNSNTYSNYWLDTGASNNYSITTTGIASTYQAGLQLQIKPINTNSGASTINVNSQGAVALTNTDGSALTAGQIPAGSIINIQHDGVKFQLLSGGSGLNSTTLQASLANTSNTALGDALIGVKKSLASAIATTIHAWISVQRIDVKADFGAVGDGITNDSSAIAAAITAALLTGGTVYFPRGNYLCSSTLVINDSSLTSESALTRISFEGEGSGNTQILCTNTTQGISYLGGTGGGINSYFSIKGIRIQGAGLGACDGLTIDNAAFLHLEDVIITGFTTGYGLRTTDMLSTLIESCEIRGNKYGVFGQRVDQSYPNAITFVATDIGVNTEFGAYFKQPTCITIVGGSIQGNGIGGVSGSRFGLKLDDGGGEGAVAMSLDGVYFEYNVNDADIFIAHTANNCVYSIDSCTFNRIDSVNFVTNNIRMDISGGTALLVTKGCGFKGFNTYAANAARPYIKVNASGGTWNFFDQGNLYFSSIEVPAISGPVRNTLAPASSYIRFNGITPSTAQKFNATLTKNGTGDYTITYDRAMSTATNTYSFALSLIGFVEIFSETTSTVRIVTKNLAGTPTDYSVVCVTVHGGADYI